jgi:hypothetical protein
MTRKILRMAALLVAVAAVAAWAAMGANCGWTKDSVPVKHTDEITGITVDIYQRQFVPGIDLLVGALLGAVVLAGISFLFDRKQTQTSSNAKIAETIP